MHLCILLNLINISGTHTHFLRKCVGNERKNGYNGGIKPKLPNVVIKLVENGY